MAQDSESSFAEKKCKPCEGGARPMDISRIERNLQKVNGWSHAGEGIAKTFNFKNYYETVAFINAVAWIAHREDHHPTIEFGYRTCRVVYKTHSINGLTENDFICAAKVDALFR